MSGSSLDACIAAVAFEGSAESWIRKFKYPRNGIAGLAPGPESVMAALVRLAAPDHTVEQMLAGVGEQQLVLGGRGVRKERGPVGAVEPFGA